MNNKTNSGLGLSFILFVVFLVLKLTNNIDWSWWWVTSPLWIPSVLLISITLFIVLVLLMLIAFGLLDPLKLKNKIQEYKKIK